MWQEIIVYAVVALAAVYAVWKLMPGAWRERLGGKAGGCGDAGSSDACANCPGKRDGGSCH
ncbi:MAG: hypothetical protein QMB72_07145 [Brachymonas denitrificans]|uniref:hypothetical protein n=1 Tax=Brachymonas denitrificans TaxID=28220 RepID=UPI001BCF62AB|nr:hypothetical protein [Brachymonas denitrificans]